MANQSLTTEQRDWFKSLGVRVTETDLAILRQIAKEGFQTHTELRAEILKSYNRTHSWDLMQRLVRAGALSAVKGDGGGIRGWSLSPLSREKLQGFFEPSWNIERRPPLYRTAFDHDVVLREVKQLICKSPAVSDWIPEHVLKSEAMTKIKYAGSKEKADKLIKVPDAVFKIKRDQQSYTLALELELTRKSKKRVFKKMESHLVSSNFDFVFFIAEKENLFQFLWDSYLDVLENSSLIKIKNQQNGIYFSTLENLRSYGLKACFKGLHDSFCFAQLA